MARVIAFVPSRFLPGSRRALRGQRDAFVRAVAVQLPGSRSCWRGASRGGRDLPCLDRASSTASSWRLACDAIRFLVDLALQGGGSHGAFTWGVLDRLLEEPWLRIDGISGTSAGAMNAAVLADGHAAGGAEGARAALEALLAQRLARRRASARCSAAPLDVLLGRWTLDHSPAFVAHGPDGARCSRPTTSTRAAPIRCARSWPRRIDFDRLAQAPIKLFVTATNVRTGRGRVFRNAEITPDVLLASACLPTMFQAVEIDGEAYWDGGYSGNPTITPLVRECASQRHDPGRRSTRSSAPGTPRTARDILNRLNEVSFNAVAAEGAAHDRAAAPGRRSRRRRGRAVGGHAHPPDRQRP